MSIVEFEEECFREMKRQILAAKQEKESKVWKRISGESTLDTIQKCETQCKLLNLRILKHLEVQ